MVLVLVVMALVMSGLLAFVNGVTAPTIDEQAKKVLAEGIKAVVGTESATVSATDTVSLQLNGKAQPYIVYHVRTPEGERAAVESRTLGFGGDLNVLVGLTADGEILGYTILESAETPGLGAKADQWFQRDGKGDIIGEKLNKHDLEVTKDGGTIDAITASTITSRAFLKAVNQAYRALKAKTKDARLDSSSANKKGETL